MNTVPEFAVIGHPNEGKSSVVSNLTEDDRIAISPVGGETRQVKHYAVRAGGRTLLEFIDTPGFEHPRKILKFFKKYIERTGSAEGVLDAFIEEKSGDRDFRYDVALLKPLAGGAAAIFVVDASHPIRKHDIAEMEILRLIGVPRMALLNNKDKSLYLDEWKRELNRHYNIIREFNALQASFPERIKLLEALKAMHQEWEQPLHTAIAALKDEWRKRLELTAEAIMRMLRKVAGHIERKIIDEDLVAVDELKEKLLERYKNRISRYEQECHREIRKLFRHASFDAELETDVIFGKEDLFSRETMKVLGLNRWQVVTAAAGTMAAGGALVDFALPGITFGVFSAGGAVVGGVSAFFGADKLGKIKLGGRHGLKLGGRTLQLGPLKEDAALLYVLIDRALLYFDTISQWSHARRDVDIVAIAERDDGRLTRNWPSGERKAVAAFFRKKSGREAKQVLRDTLVAKMVRHDA